MSPDIHETQIGPNKATSLQYAGTGPKVHFYHANGFGASCYQPYLATIAQHYSVSALNMRPLWPEISAPNPRRGWEQYGDDLIAWLEATQDAPILAIAHSMGAATTAMAANKRPDLFRGLVLVEPAGVTHRLYRLMRLLPYTLRRRLDPAHSVFHRRNHWHDLEELYRELRAIRAYKRFSDASLRDLVTAMTTADSSGFRLAFPPLWEAHNYVMPPRILPVLKRLSVPTHVIAAKPSVFVDPAILNSLRNERPDIRFTDLPAHGHLLPLEAPNSAATATLHALRRLQNSVASSKTAA
ncbi:alpha/beta fold hydrolase [Shimia sediminis]|uniref:alpha/beta fold hydrolase n=1 Tax=Shimia sediminis TaxID=2497945 RepID=UPI000F8DF007|nr:alpha/beta hydrolase [Shimia sediminis]